MNRGGFNEERGFMLNRVPPEDFLPEDQQEDVHHMDQLVRIKEIDVCKAYFLVSFLAWM